MNTSSPQIGLFVSCMIDLTAPRVGFAAVQLLKDAGCKVNIPVQSCCGQPAYNNGDRRHAIDIAKATIETFSEFEHIVVPSASCAGMIRYHYPKLFDKGSIWHERAVLLGERTFELIDYLYTLRGMQTIDATLSACIAYHESCSARREMKTTGARELLSSIKGAKLIELGDNNECCGFGGLFSVKYDALSNAIVERKINAVTDQNVEILTGVDLGCLHNIAGKLKRAGHDIKVCHIAELLHDVKNAA